MIFFEKYLLERKIIPYFVIRKWKPISIVLKNDLYIYFNYVTNQKNNYYAQPNYEVTYDDKTKKGKFYMNNMNIDSITIFENLINLFSMNMSNTG